MHQTTQQIPSDPRHAGPTALSRQLKPAPEPHSDKTVWDGTNTNPHPNSYADVGPDQPYEPWSIKTATASITSIQNIYRKEHKRPLTREDSFQSTTLLKFGESDGQTHRGHPDTEPPNATIRQPNPKSHQCNNSTPATAPTAPTPA